MNQRDKQSIAEMRIRAYFAEKGAAKRAAESTVTATEQAKLENELVTFDTALPSAREQKFQRR